MRNLADVIENFLVEELLASKEHFILVQRNDLAERLECAPSQISYALSTRFTPERGFMVESRRGTGGFIRIVRLQREQQASPVKTKSLTPEELLQYLVAERLLTVREQHLLHYMLELLPEGTSAEVKNGMIREACGRLTPLKLGAARRTK